MTDQEQRRADHLAMVAAPIYAALRFSEDCRSEASDELRAAAINDAEALQCAAEERVSKQ